MINRICRRQASLLACRNNPCAGMAASMHDIGYSSLDGALVFTHPLSRNTYHDGMFMRNEPAAMRLVIQLTPLAEPGSGESPEFRRTVTKTTSNALSPLLFNVHRKTNNQVSRCGLANVRTGGRGVRMHD